MNRFRTSRIAFPISIWWPTDSESRRSQKAIHQGVPLFFSAHAGAFGKIRLEMQPMVPESDDKLLAECVVETFRAGGPGGQNVNARDTAVRVRHLPTGIVVTSQQERSQLRNKQIALAELRRRLEELSRPRRRRIPTSAPRAARRRVLEAKRRRSEKKQLRRKPRIDG